MNNDDNDQDLLEPPKYDMLRVRFMGDNYDMFLPYCEVANGDLISIDKDNVKISIIKDDVNEVVEMGYIRFVELVEKTFDTKGIAKLSAQLAGSYEAIQIL
jgi:hypothetical protein